RLTRADRKRTERRAQHGQARTTPDTDHDPEAARKLAGQPQPRRAGARAGAAREAVMARQLRLGRLGRTRAAPGAHAGADRGRWEGADPAVHDLVALAAVRGVRRRAWR